MLYKGILNRCVFLSHPEILFSFFLLCNSVCICGNGLWLNTFYQWFLSLTLGYYTSKKKGRVAWKLFYFIFIFNESLTACNHLHLWDSNQLEKNLFICDWNFWIVPFCIDFNRMTVDTCNHWFWFLLCTCLCCFCMLYEYSASLLSAC